jgi:putative restriction endonuclease
MTREQRAQQLWAVLALAATDHRLLTYDEVARITGLPRQSIGDCLRPIQAYCMQNGFPHLTSIVVSEKTGLPGDGFIADADAPAAQMRVFKWNWLETKAPSAEQFAAAYPDTWHRRSRVNCDVPSTNAISKSGTNPKPLNDEGAPTT